MGPNKFSKVFSKLLSNKCIYIYKIHIQIKFKIFNLCTAERQHPSSPNDCHNSNSEIKTVCNSSLLWSCYYEGQSWGFSWGAVYKYIFRLTLQISIHKHVFLYFNSFVMSYSPWIHNSIIISLKMRKIWVKMCSEALSIFRITF